MVAMPVEPIILWAVLLLAAALILFFIEVFVPSGGVIGVAAAIALLAGIVLLFRANTTIGLSAAIAAVIALPILFGVAIKMWPNTPIGRLLALQTRQQRLMHPDGESDDHSSETNDLAGAAGKALTDLRPIGTCSIHGKRIDCLAIGGMIDAGSRIQVISVEGTQIKVRMDRGDQG